MEYYVRPMKERDIPQVKDIDREAFPTQWPVPNFSRDLNNGVIRYLVAFKENGKLWLPEESGGPESGFNSPGFLSRIRGLFDKGSFTGQGEINQKGDDILGYAAMWLMVDEAHLTSIAVRETHRRQRIGELLLTSIIELAMELKASVVTLEVRESNLVAQSLYEKYGFAIVGRRRGYYSDDGEDALIMTTEKIINPAYQSMLQELKQKLGLELTRSFQTDCET